MKLYNSLTRKKEEFVPLDENNVGMYVCGPTVYSSPHLGNARSTVVYDLLYRVLKESYKKVNFVRNITDIDDKIIDASNKRGISIVDLTKEITDEFHADMHSLGNIDPDVEPRATEHIEEIILMIEKLIEQGNAYFIKDHVYFSVKSYYKYGELSGKKIDDLIEGARVEVEKSKKDARDFVLWKPAKENEGESSFDSPWGRGRPGWHIECSAMSSKYLGDDFDIHGGGADLKFPHHENEIAQSRCANKGSDFAKYWVHNGFLTVNGEKMSKSLGNFITVKELFRDGVEGRALRLIFLATHYRKPLDYNYSALENSRKNLERIDNLLEGFNEDISKIKLPEEFLESLNDDLNISPSLAYMFELIKNLNKNKDIGSLRILAKIVDFLALRKVEEEEIPDLPNEIFILAKDIQNARAAKQYQLADELRDKISVEGYVVKYTKTGEVEVKKK